MKCIALDLETTGLDPKTSEIIEIAAIRIEDGKILDSFTTLVKPLVDPSPSVQMLTGIFAHDLVDAPALLDVTSKLIEFVGDLPILGQNISFDIGFLKEKGVVFSNLQLDTFNLAKALIPHSDSYSLEILAEKFHISQPSAHRAYDDAYASYVLYEKLLTTLDDHDDAALSALKDFLSKFEWSWKQYVLSYIDDVLSGIKEASREKSASLEAELSQVVTAESLVGKKLTSGMYDENQLCFSEPTYVAVPYYKLKHSGEGILYPEYHYVSKEKFENLVKNISHVDDDAASFFVKLLLWFFVTKTYETSEIKYSGKDLEILSQICLQEGEYSEIYEKRLSELRERKTVYLSHQNLYRYVLHGTQLPLGFSNLLIKDGIEFEKFVSKQGSVAYYAYEFPESFAEIFSDLKNAYTRLAPENLSYPEIEVQMEEFFAEPVHSIIARLKEKLVSIKCYGKQKILLEALNHNIENQSILLQLQNDGNVILKLAPKYPLKLLRDALWNSFTNIAIDDVVMCFRKDAFLQNAFQLDDFFVHGGGEARSENVPYTVPFLADPKARNFAEICAEYLSKIVVSANAEQREYYIVLLPSASQLSVMHEILSKMYPQKSHVKLLAQNVSGSIGKLLQKMKGQSTCLLVTFEFSLELFEEMKKLNTDKVYVYLTKLPFLHPDNSYMKYMSGFFRNSYTSYSLPKAILLSQKVMKKFMQLGEHVKLFIFDKRYDDEMRR